MLFRSLYRRKPHPLGSAPKTIEQPFLPPVGDLLRQVFREVWLLQIRRLRGSVPSRRDLQWVSNQKRRAKESAVRQFKISPLFIYVKTLLQNMVEIFQQQMQIVTTLGRHFKQGNKKPHSQLRLHDKCAQALPLQRLIPCKSLLKQGIFPFSIE